MENHVHIGFVSITATLLAVIAIIGTLHLLAMSSDTRAARAFLALGF
jgi:hypothetical protein